ncbi:MAG: M48 family metallopeptidase [Micropepsaceae bacterium]
MALFKRNKAPVDTFVFPPSPAVVPEGLTKPTPKYRRHATLAMLSLIGFMAIYLALMGWFAWTAYQIFATIEQFDGNEIWVAVAGACSAFLALFMAKSLVFFQKGAGNEDMELKAKDHPRLFKFLHAIADETGAPKPHRVFLSPRVNAAVFYDLNFFNLIFPSKKNLEIGLGLVNVLTLSELKAVLAHEFGHFAQKTMAVGRWVYVAQQIATQVVNKRDALDKFLVGLGRFDLRVAWIGWILQFVVWSIRSLTDTLLSGVILAQRALSREMEFQADLVSVSATGSEALINALHKLSGADDALDRTFGFANAEYGNKTPVKDVFAVQSRVLEHLRSIYNDPHYGATPAPAAEAPELHRVFKSDVAAPPRMWATHPANADREDNAKIVFVRCELDDRSAWELFPNAAELREQMTAHLFAPAAAAPEPVPPPVPLEESFARLDQNYSSITIDKRYRGAYLGRAIARGFKNPGDMYNDAPAGNVPARLGALYPQTFGDALEKLRELFDEKNTFEGLQKGYLKAPGGVVRWRGEEVPPRQLPKILKSLDDEIDPIKSDIATHDREVRSAHLAAAKAIGNGWDAYLTGLGGLIHYAEHTHANLVDVHGVFNNVFAVVTADRKVSAKEMKRLIAAGNDVHDALEAVHKQALQLGLDERTAKRAEITNYKEALGEFTLPPASDENVGDWLRVIDGWVNGAAGLLMSIRSSALQELLIAEDQVANALAKGTPLTAAPAAPVVPAEYPRLMLGDARPRQEKLSWWDRFQTADGWFAASARFTVAASVVGAVIAVGALLSFNGPAESAEPVPVYYDPAQPNLAPTDIAPQIAPSEPAPPPAEPEALPEEPALAPPEPGIATGADAIPEETVAPASPEAATSDLGTSPATVEEENQPSPLRRGIE